MSEPQIRRYAGEKGFHPQTLARWLAWEERARDALYRLAFGLKIGENHLRDLMDWLEEIALRDKRPIEQILGENGITDIETDPRLGRADKLKRIKEQVRRQRFPRLAQTEDAIRARIQQLKLPPEVRVTAPPGLEGGKLHVEFAVATGDEFKRLVAALAGAAEAEPTREIFGLLAGSSADAKHKTD